jgi:hypothetical protein
MREIRSLWETRFGPVILSSQRHEVERHLGQVGDRHPGFGEIPVDQAG